MTSLSSARERALLITFAGLQFSHILDFMILAPLGPQFMRLWNIGASEFSWLVSIYSISAAVAGIVATFYIDRFDRRRSLLVLFAGFTISTALCAAATGFHSLVVIRAVAGVFGGIISPVVMAIVSDVIPAERRGRAMGIVMGAFPIVAVAGVPIGLALATNFGWRAPFIFLGAVGIALWIAAWYVVPSIAGHVKSADAHEPLNDFLDLFRVRNHRLALLCMAIFTFSGFSLFSFISVYQVRNIGITEADLATVYFAGGVATLFTSRLFGKLSDRYGKRRMFVMLCVTACIPMLIFTHMGRAPLWAACAIAVFFMVFVSGRFIPLLAFISMCISPKVRGAFMSLQSAVQSMASGIAVLLAGAVVGQAADGAMTRFNIVGIYAVIAALTCVWLVFRLQPLVTDNEAAPLPLVEKKRRKTLTIRPHNF